MTQSENKTIVDRLLDLDRRIIYVIVILCLAAPLIQPWGLPIAVSNLTQDYHNEIQALQPGDSVVLLCDIESGMLGTHLPQAIVSAKELWDRPGIKIFQAAFYRADGAINFETLVLPVVEDESKKKYGVDWVNLGYMEGKEAALAAFGADIDYIGKDYYGNSLAGMPIFEGVESLNDVKLLVIIGGMHLEATRQLAAPYPCNANLGITALGVADYISYKQAGMVHGILNDLTGAAEYEFLTGRPGRAIISSDALSAAHIFLLLIVIFVNIIYIATRSGGKR
jgi:hypothetical protein